MFLSVKGKTILALILLVVWTGLINVNCGKGENKTEVIEIGVLLPLTGPAATLGKPGLNAVELAIDEVNAERQEGEPQIKIIPEDTKAQTGIGVSALKKLYNADGVKVAVGPLTSSVTLAVAPIAERNKFTIISPGSSAPKVSDSGDYIFRNELSDLEGGRIQATIAMEKLGYKKMACVYINTDYGSGLHEVFKETFEAKGGEIVFSEAFLPGTTDFRTVITKILSETVDAVFLVAIDETVNFVRQRAELGLKAPIFSTPIFENKAYLDQLGELAEGILYVYYGKFDPDSEDGQIKTFLNSYMQRFNVPPTYYSALAYDAAKIICLSLKNANYDVTKVKDEIYKIKNFKGISGDTSFDKNGDVSKPVSLKVVKDGRFTFIEE